MLCGWVILNKILWTMLLPWSRSPLKRAFAMHGSSVFPVIQRTLVFQGQQCAAFSEITTQRHLLCTLTQPSSESWRSYSLLWLPTYASRKRAHPLIPGAAQVRSDVVLGLCAGITLSVNASEVLKPGIESERMPPLPRPQGHLGFELLKQSPVKAIPVRT